MLLVQPNRCAEYDNYIKKCVEENSAPANFIPLAMAIMIYESGCNPYINGSKGEKGLMQILPDNFERLGIENPYDPRENICGGVRYLKYLYDLTKSEEIPERIRSEYENMSEEERLKYIIAGYNGGDAVIKRKRISNTDYVKNVWRIYKVLEELEALIVIFPDVSFKISLKEVIQESPELKAGEEFGIRIKIEGSGKDLNKVNVVDAIFSFPEENFTLVGGKEKNGWKIVRRRVPIINGVGEVELSDLRVKKVKDAKFKVRIGMCVRLKESERGRIYLPAECPAEKEINIPEKGLLDPEGCPSISYEYSVHKREWEKKDTQ
jgi:hypothetical protein